MSEPVTISFAKHGAAPSGVLLFLTDETLPPNRNVLYRDCNEATSGRP